MLYKKLGMVKYKTVVFPCQLFIKVCLVLALFCSSVLAAEKPGNNPLGRNGHDNDNAKKPINIEADHLQVDDKDQVAIYSGNVNATQGDHVIRAAKLEIAYERANSGSTKDNPKAVAQQRPAVAASDNNASDAAGNQQIKTITAIGNVIVSSTKDDQTASGDRAFYDVKSQKILLTVDPKSNHFVVLTNNGNIVKGKKLAIDLASGLYIIDPPDAGIDPKGAVVKHRVSTILIPGSNGKASGEGKKPNFLGGGGDEKKKTPPQQQAQPQPPTNIPDTRNDATWDWLNKNR